MSYHLKNSGSLFLTAFVVGLGLASAACEDESAGVSGDGGGGNAGESPVDLEASTSMGGTANDGGTGGSATGGAANGSGGVGGGGSSNGGSTSTSDGPASGGTGGMDSGPSGSGGSAGANPFATPCEDDPRCASFTPGSFCVGSFSTTCEDEDEDGCLDFSQHNCARRTCVDGECVAGNDGEACDDAIDVVGSGLTLAGADFGADFADDLALGGEGCGGPYPLTPDVVFQVALEAGQTLSVLQRGAVDTVAHLQDSCGASADCSASSDDVDYEPLDHTALTDETVTVVVESYDEVPNPAWYRLHVDIDPECGNGLLEASEDCDVGDPAVSVGCSEACTVEFAYECSETSPSLCTPVESLGEFDAAETTERIVSEDRFEVWQQDLWQITLLEAVVFDLEARSRLPGAGDINVDILNESGRVMPYRVTGDEIEYDPIGLAAGTYVIRVWAETPLAEGYQIDFWLGDPGDCGDGTLDKPLEQCDTGGEPGCTEACLVAFDNLCNDESPTVCTPIESFGVLGPGATPDPVVTVEPLPVGERSYWLFSLSEEVLVNLAVLVNNDVGDADVFIYSTDGSYISLETDINEIHTLQLPAGDYKLEVYAHHALDDGYTLTLSTVAL